MEALNLLGIDGSLILLQTIPFVLALVGLNALIFRPMLAMLAEREKNIHGFRKEAELLQEELADKVAELDERLAAARVEAAAHRNQLRAEGKEREDAITARARQESSAILSAARQELEAETVRARAILKEAAGGLSLQIASTVLGRSLEN